MPNFYAVIRESLKRSGLSERDIDYLAILHFKRSAHLAVLQVLGLGRINRPIGRTMAILARTISCCR